jgi:EAL domain-containing protein (putative c-di-GMP-specific phosphodiesterase class I)
LVNTAFCKTHRSGSAFSDTFVVRSEVVGGDKLQKMMNRRITRCHFIQTSDRFLRHLGNREIGIHRIVRVGSHFWTNTTRLRPLMLCISNPPRTDETPPDTRDQQPSRYRLTPNVRAEAAERRRLARDLGEATRDGLLLIHYQPRLDLDTGRMLAAAALLRWPHRKRGLVSPRVFLPLAERSGQMPDIGAWALATACREANDWPEPWSVSVTVANGQLVASALLGQVATALASSGLAPERLELSMPEALLVDVGGETYLMLAALRDLGVGVALDDFGIGLASLAMLRRLPLTKVKLDRSLVRDVTCSREDAAIVRATIDAGHVLGLTAIADGVETEAQRAFLAGCGCDQGQGPLFGQPLPSDRMAGRMAA